RPYIQKLASEPAITIEPVTATSQDPTINDGKTLDTITRDHKSAIPDPSTSAPEFTCPKYNATHCENRRYVYPGDCTKYYACYECMSDIFKCPWAFEYHSILQECVDPMYSDCEDREPAVTIEPVTAISQDPTTDNGMTIDPMTKELTSAIPDPSTSAPEFTCPKYNATHCENRRYVYPGDCTKYYACYECMSDIFKCPWAFEYHSILQECVDPMYSDCEG
ncbi:hypothetical protein CAPTEDRAFT_187666, partial [Capitella teleta]